MVISFWEKIIKKIKSEPAYNQLLDSVLYDRFPIAIEGVFGSLQSFLLSEFSLINKGRILVVFPTSKEAESFSEDCAAFGFSPTLLPNRDRTIYSGLPIDLNSQAKRLSALAKLVFDQPQPKEKIVVGSLANLLQPVVPKSYLEKQIILLKRGMTINPSQLEKQLVDMGFTRVPRVSLEGEFSLKGEVLDIFLPGNSFANRVMYEWDQIVKIGEVDPFSYISLQEKDSLILYPIKEFDWNQERISVLEKYLLDRPILKKEMNQILLPLEEGQPITHENLFFYLSFEKCAYLTDYFDQEGDLIIFVGMERLERLDENLHKEWVTLYSQTRREKIPAPHPEDLFCSLIKIQDNHKRLFRIFEIRQNQNERKMERIVFDSSEPLSFFGNISFLKSEIENFCSNRYDVMIFSDTETQQARIEQILKEFPVEVIPESLSSGFILPQQKLLVINDRELFGRKKRVPASVKKARSKAIDTFVELVPGDYVVHINYGIGLFRSIERVPSGGNERDYIKIEFADEETIFIPVEQLNFIQKYIGSEGSSPRLDRIGSKSWSARKAAVKKSVEELAKKLLDIYARRRQTKGHAFTKDTEWQIEFEAAFPFEETPDQLQCVQEIKEDMESEQPMDRLVCGDVGYGKTEVALRAAFKAIVEGRQVAFLAPTTILTEQHYQNALNRFEKFPVRIEMLSRFVKPAKIKTILQKLELGEIDLIIGTHRLLSQDVRFKNLGLLIIDEEQRFGVKHKERLKAMKVSIDCLALSATPIPRTLHMSLLKIRDMSLLTTPPYNRKPIETIICEFNDEMVARAIRFELNRGGQIFFLHNRIESLDSIHSYLEKLVPEAMVATAHGRMGAEELEDLMHAFIRGDFNLLLATTIIENGIDIPNVNTIIIDRADSYGIGQLYQLRGRVGRSDRTGMAYLFYPPHSAISELAMKRLQIISENTELGSGFKVAMKDLEVRGAGNLLGKEQSGQIASVGYELYIRMLEETVIALEGKEKEFGEDIVLDLVYSGFIPDSYVQDPVDKMVFYKKIASVQSDLELLAITSELNDRFGTMPVEVQSLLCLAEIRILCRKLFISQMREKNGYLEIQFEKVHLINTNKVVRLLQEGRGNLSFDPRNPRILKIKTHSIGLEEKSEFIRDYLNQLV